MSEFLRSNLLIIFGIFIISMLLIKLFLFILLKDVNGSVENRILFGFQRMVFLKLTKLELFKWTNYEKAEIRQRKWFYWCGDPDDKDYLEFKKTHRTKKEILAHKKETYELMKQQFDQYEGYRIFAIDPDELRFKFRSDVLDIDFRMADLETIRYTIEAVSTLLKILK